MALERIDPFTREDRFCLDHILRYAWAAPLVDGQRVLDAACGLGFGSTLLAHANAAAVVGVDLDAPSIDQCRQWWPHPRLQFDCQAIEALPSANLAPFDRIVTFETLEHVADPVAAITVLRGLLKPEGILLGSVPGETDWSEDNEFHLHFFNDQRLTALLGAQFPHVRLLRQRNHLASIIEEWAPAAEPASPATLAAIHPHAASGIRIDFGRAPAWADTWLFMASAVPLPPAPACSFGLSRMAWLEFAGEAASASREVAALSNRYRKLFLDHGDLVRRFTNVLGWGKYHHERASGKVPDEHYLKTIEAAQTAREQELRAKVDQLQADIAHLRAEVAVGRRAREELNAVRRTQFESAVGSPPPHPPR
jgi:SAM-dependent methyltransferase